MRGGITWWVYAEDFLDEIFQVRQFLNLCIRWVVVVRKQLTNLGAKFVLDGVVLGEDEESP